MVVVEEEVLGSEEGGFHRVRRVRLFFHTPSFFPPYLLCGVEEKRGAVKLERVPDI